MARSWRQRFQLTRNRKRALIWIGVLVAFVAVLTAWSAGPTGGDHSKVALPATSSTAPGGSPAPTLLPPTRVNSSTTGKPGAPSNILSLVPNLPGSSRNVNPASLPARSVVITVTSDRPILRMGYRVLYGHPDEGSAINIASPMQITTVGRGYGLVAAIGAQSTPIASYITCTITVDGHLHSSHTVRGGYSVVVCLG